MLIKTRITFYHFCKWRLIDYQPLFDSRVSNKDLVHASFRVWSTNCCPANVRGVGRANRGKRARTRPQPPFPSRSTRVRSSKVRLRNCIWLWNFRGTLSFHGENGSSANVAFSTNRREINMRGPIWAAIVRFSRFQENAETGTRWRWSFAVEFYVEQLRRIFFDSCHP